MNSHAKRSTVHRALLALAAAFALLMAFVAGDARGAYTVGTPLSVPGDQVSSVAVNQSTRDVYVGRYGPLSGGLGDVHRFNFSGTDLGCALSPSPARPAGVTVNPLDGSLRVLDISSTAANSKLRKFPGVCGAEDTTSPFPAAITAANSKLYAQPASDAAGNTYVPNPTAGTLQKFQPDGTEVTTGGFPIAGITNASSAAVDSSGNIYVLNARTNGVSERQTITIVGANEGDTFRLNFNGTDTAPIAYSATGATRAANIRAALEALPAISSNNVAVSTAAAPIVTFQGSLTSVDVPLLGCAHSFTGATPDCTVATTTAPGAKTLGALLKFEPDGDPLGTVLSGDFTTFARDSRTGELFLGTGWGGGTFAGFHVEKRSPRGALLADFGSGSFTTPLVGGAAVIAPNPYNQIAVDETSGTVYAVDSGGAGVEVFTAPTKFPLAIDTDNGTGTGTVSCDLGAGTEASCLSSYDEGTVVTLKATPTPPATFTSWSGCDSIVAGDCRVTMSGARSVTAVFDLAPPPAVTSISPDHGPAAGGNQVTITGTDFTGATAVRFGANNATGVTVDSATQIRATAPAGTRGTTVNVAVTTPSGTSVNVAADDYDYDLPSFVLSVNKAGAGSGSVTCDGGACAASYIEGTRVTLAASAASGSTFAGWSGGGCSGTAPCEVTIAAATTVTATFTLNDTDGDGVADNSDACPAQAASTANGCPAPVDPGPGPGPGPGTDPSACQKQANAAYQKALKAAKKKRGKARARAIKAAKKKKTRSVSRCKASLSRPGR